MSADLQPSHEAETEPTVNSLTSKYARLSLTDLELLAKMHQDGRTQADIAQVLQCSKSTVSDNLAKLKQTPALVQALMKGESVTMLRQWKRASVKAAKRGDHRPAREWIEAAHPELRPQQGNNAGGGGVTINIGMPGQPIALPDITIEATKVSPVEISSGGETSPNR